VSLYQQIVGRGLRLFEGKEDCLILDYTGVPHDIFSPEIADRRPLRDAVAVQVSCPQCEHKNIFWGIQSSGGEILEHFGKKCQGAIEDPENGEIVPCGFRYRYRNCEHCGTENDIGARICNRCHQELIDDQSKLKEAHAQKDSHVMRPDSMEFLKKRDSKRQERLEIRYYDHDGQHLSEIFFFDSPESAKVFYYNFQRMHQRNAGAPLRIDSIDAAILAQERFRLPLFVIARKQGKFWRIREKIFY
jgi:DNA repair protein RadD